MISQLIKAIDAYFVFVYQKCTMNILSSSEDFAQMCNVKTDDAKNWNTFPF